MTNTAAVLATQAPNPKVSHTESQKDNQTSSQASAHRNPRMPAVFIGHGSPMLAIQDNPFTPAWHALANSLPTPKGIVVISAHWQTRGTAITTNPSHELLYDFYGFPEEMYQLQYPAKGDPDLAARIQTLLDPVIKARSEATDSPISNPINSHVVGVTNQPIDHGVWSVLMHMYPEANIPVVELSLDATLSGAQHLALGNALSTLRDQGILILGSGNLVHNLRLIDRRRMNDIGYGYDWAQQAQDTLLPLITSGDWQTLANFQDLGEAVQQAIPTPEHFYPLLYVLGTAIQDDTVNISLTDLVGGSLDMTCVQVG